MNLGYPDVLINSTDFIVKSNSDFFEINEHNRFTADCLMIHIRETSMLRKQ